MMLSINNETNHQLTTIIEDLTYNIQHFINNVRVCWIIRITVSNVYVCLKHSWRNESNQFERRDENPRQKGSFFKV